MADKPRFVLPIIERALDDARRLVRESPTVDVAREQLGGRVGACANVGEVVTLRSVSAGAQTGVVLFREAGSVDVWIGGGRVRRVAEDALGAFTGPIPNDLRDISSGARVFARLGEGDRVRYESPSGELDRALLVEKCRYGALVVTDEGKVMAIGFRGLWPTSKSAT